MNTPTTSNAFVHLFGDSRIEVMQTTVAPQQGRYISMSHDRTDLSESALRKLPVRVLFIFKIYVTH